MGPAAAPALADVGRFERHTGYALKTVAVTMPKQKLIRVRPQRLDV